MISNGNVTLSVSSLDAAIRYYTETLGFSLTNRIGDRWATISAGPSYWTSAEVNAGLILGLRPAAPQLPAPGTISGVGFGLETYQRIETVAAQLKKRGVRLAGEAITFEAGHIVAFTDLDGVPSYAWEFSAEMIAEDPPSADEADAMLCGGHAIVYVSDMDAAVRFYADTLGMKLTYRFESKFATVEIGQRLVLALHPQTPNTPIPGTKGSATLGLIVDEPMDKVLARLAQRGVRVPAPPKPSGEGGTGQSEPGRSVDIEDLDGNVITLWEARALISDGEFAAPGMSARR